MNQLDARTLRFFKNFSGSLSLSVGDTSFFEAIQCTPLFPVTDPDNYIAVQETKGTESREIGIIPDIGDLAPDERRLVREDILFRYFVPEILDIIKITKKKGRETWRTITDRGEKTFRIADKHETIVVTDKGVVFLTDTDRCRYKISNPSSLPPKARLLLEKNLL